MEVVDAKEQAHAPGKLVTDRSCFPLAIGSCQQQPGHRARRPHDHPALRSPVPGAHIRRVLDQVKAEHIDEEPDRLVVVVDDQCGVLDVHAFERTTSTGRRARPRSSSEPHGRFRER